jgi:hypothetical protein
MEQSAVSGPTVRLQSSEYQTGRRVISLRFVGFWEGFDTGDNFFTRFLAPAFEFDQESDPDFTLYMTVGSRRWDFLGYDSTRIFFTGENVVVCEFMTPHRFESNFGMN